MDWKNTACVADLTQLALIGCIKGGYSPDQLSDYWIF